MRHCCAQEKYSSRFITKVGTSQLTLDVQQISHVLHVLHVPLACAIALLVLVIAIAPGPYPQQVHRQPLSGTGRHQRAHLGPEGVPQAPLLLGRGEGLVDRGACRAEYSA